MTLWLEVLKNWSEDYPQLDVTHIGSYMFGHCALSHGLSRHGTSLIPFLYFPPVITKLLNENNYFI